MATTQLGGAFWRFLRKFQNYLRGTPIPHPQLLLFPFVQNQNVYTGPLARGGVHTIQDAINFILLSLPARWPFPVPMLAVGLISVASAIVNGWVAFDLARDIATNNEILSIDVKCQSDIFDYVIVGGGTAGMVVATRLANSSRNVRVLLLEAGGEPSIINDIPGLDFYLMRQPANTWTYQSVPQRHVCHNCNQWRTMTSRGKMLGGSSGINFMLYSRGNKEDYNQWAVDTQDELWNYENVLPYFKKSEDYNGAYANDATWEDYHGKGGLLNIDTPKFTPGLEDFLAAGMEKGYTIGDYNGENQEVFSKMEVTTQEGWRESTFRAFYQDTGKPPNLCIKKYAKATKIVFAISGESSMMKAVGVTYERHNLSRTVAASKEVILCAGVFESPKLLMLSGVGPYEDLTALGIPVVLDLPVGKNLQDHVYSLLGPFMKGPSSNPNKELTVKSASKFVTSGDGPFATPAGFTGQAFLKSPFAQRDYPDLQLIQFSISLHPELPETLHEILGLNRKLLKKWLDPETSFHLEARLVTVLLTRPKSTGQLSLSGTDHRDELIIDPNYLSHEDDRKALLHGMKKTLELYENTTILRAPLFEKAVPGCDTEEFKSDSYLTCLMKHLSGSFYHHVGTCAMGQVVDSRLKVKGVSGLRVIDASVMPKIPNTNTYAATVMLAEKGADFVIYDMMRQKKY